MSIRRTFILSFIVALAAWGALAALMYTYPPSDLLQAAALALIVVAVAATTLPVWLRIQQRLTPKLAAAALPQMALRQGVWAGLYVAILVQLRVWRVLDWALVFVLLALFLMLEAFIQQRSLGPQRGKPAAAFSKPVPKMKAGKKRGKRGK